jgi:hypothetical protein
MKYVESDEYPVVVAPVDAIEIIPQTTAPIIGKNFNAVNAWFCTLFQCVESPLSAIQNEIAKEIKSTIHQSTLKPNDSCKHIIP